MKRLFSLFLVVMLLMSVTCSKAEEDTAIYVDTTIPKPVEEDTAIYVDTTIPKPVEEDTAIYVDTTIPKPVEENTVIYVDTTIPESVEEDTAIYVDTTIPEPVEEDTAIYVDTTIPEPVEEDTAIYVDTTIPKPAEEDSVIFEGTVGTPVETPERDSATVVDTTVPKPVETPERDSVTVVDTTVPKPVETPERDSATVVDTTVPKPVETPKRDSVTVVDTTVPKPVQTENNDEGYSEDVTKPVHVKTPEPEKTTKPTKTHEPEETKIPDGGHKHDVYLSTRATYEEYDEDYHLWRDTVISYCKVCGEHISNKEDKKKESHRFNRYGICQDCGYQKECNHENLRERYLDTSEAEYYNEQCHFIVTTMEVYCGNCGEDFGESEYEEYLNHIVENGRCNVCDQQLYIIPEIVIGEDTSDQSIEAETIVLHINDNIGYCDGSQITWDLTPTLKNNKTMLPLKQLMQMVGGKFVEWNGESKSATFFVNGKYLTYTAGKKTVEGTNNSMKNPASILSNTMYVEITSVVTEAGYKVSFYDNYCIIAKEDLAKEVVHDYATTYYGADFSYKPQEISKADKHQAQDRVNELEYVISSANTAYENGVISKERLKEIVKNAEEGIEEYEEVITGVRELETVSEKESQYKAVSGSDSGIVAQTQRQLLGFGYSSQTVNGRYDEITFNNVLYFQITNGLEATGWLDEETVKAINKRELEIAEAKITVTTQDFVEVEKPDNWEYAKKSLNQVVLGNFTDDVTFVGTAVTVGAAFIGVDLALDVRDITADIVKWEWSWPHAGQTALDAIALVPVVGVLKHTDEVVLLVKSGDKIHAVTKQAGDVAGLVKYADDAADVGKHVDDVVYKTLDEGLNFSAKALEHFQNVDRFVSTQMLIDTIKNGVSAPDPQGVAGLVMYYKRVAINGKTYNLEVLYEATTNTVKHFMYDRNALGPLTKIIN